MHMCALQEGGGRFTYLPAFPTWLVAVRETPRVKSEKQMQSFCQFVAKCKMASDGSRMTPIHAKRMSDLVGQGSLNIKRDSLMR